MTVIWLLPIIPICFALITIITRRATGRLIQWLSEGVALTCALICVAIMVWASGDAWLWALVAAFVLSIGGDMFLTYRTKDVHYVAGIALFLLAHLGFLAFAITRVPFSWLRFGVVAALGLVLYFAVLLPHSNLKKRPAMAVAVIVYIMISCASLAAALDLTSHSAARWVFAAGITSLAVSDIMIALRDFRGVSKVKPWVMPLYFLCHILVAVSVVLESVR